jgi:pimeloyl-ACP methyl ester carboxylesterase
MGNYCKPKTEPVKNANLVLEPDDVLKERARAMEREIIIRIGLKIDEDVFIKDIDINYHGNNHIHTIICIRDDQRLKPSILFIHGYQGTGVLFYKLFKDFVDQFNVYCIDMIGMGLSSRPQVQFKTPEEYLDFFIGSIEMWRQAMGIEMFYLIGHSLGGYFSALYTMRFPQNVIQLTLLSPAGITDFTKPRTKKFKHRSAEKCILRVFKMLGVHKLTLQEMAHNNKLMKRFVKRYIRRNLQIPEEEKAWVTNLLILLLKFPYDLNWTIFYMFHMPVPSAKVPIEDKLAEFKADYKIDIYYGEKDWMDRQGAMRLIEKAPDRFRVFEVPEYGHNFVIENPCEFQKHFLQNYKFRSINV